MRFELFVGPWEAPLRGLLHKVVQLSLALLVTLLDVLASRGLP